MAEIYTSLTSGFKSALTQVFESACRLLLSDHHVDRLLCIPFCQSDVALLQYMMSLNARSSWSHCSPQVLLLFRLFHYWQYTLVA